MDMQDRGDVAAWLAVHNDAYGHAWEADDYRRAILEHPFLTVSDTFFVVGPDGPVGTASVGAYRANDRVGVGHYLGVTHRAQGLGLGSQLVAHRYAVLRDAGFTACESQTHVGRVGSLLIHFNCGFHPKYRRDHWNNPDHASRPLRALTNQRLRALYRNWSRRAR